MKIPLFKPLYDEKDKKALADALDSGWTGLGPKVREFENAFTKYLQGSGVSIALNSCTAALDLALKLLNIGPEDEVIVPAITFASTAHVVRYNGGRLIIADIDPDSLHLDLDDVKKKITPRTKAVIPVHLYGNPFDIESLRNLGDFYIIEDAAHACGAYYSTSGHKVGTKGDMSCFSFQAVKNLSTGDGGMLVVNNKDLLPLVDRARKLRWLGISKDTWERSGNERYWWEYDIDEIGYKFHMNDLAASLGLTQLEKLDHMNAKRRSVGKLYDHYLAGVPNIELFKFAPGASYHIYPIRVKSRKRDELAKFLASHGIQTGVHYKPLHFYKCYNIDVTRPGAEKAWQEILSLPMHCHLTEEDVKYITDKIKEFVWN